MGKVGLKKIPTNLLKAITRPERSAVSGGGQYSQEQIAKALAKLDATEQDIEKQNEATADDGAKERNSNNGLTALIRSCRDVARYHQFAQQLIAQVGEWNHNGLGNLSVPGNLESAFAVLFVQRGKVCRDRRGKEDRVRLHPARWGRAPGRGAVDARGIRRRVVGSDGAVARRAGL